VTNQDFQVRPARQRSGRSPGTKLDLKAIYRRPRRTIGEYDEVIQERGPDGLPLFDIIGAAAVASALATGRPRASSTSPSSSPAARATRLAVRRGLAARAGLNPSRLPAASAVRHLEPEALSGDGDHADIDKFSALRALVEQFGSDVVLAIQRRGRSTFTLPARCRTSRPAGR
jgi:hypothetical protein